MLVGPCLSLTVQTQGGIPACPGLRRAQFKRADINRAINDAVEPAASLIRERWANEWWISNRSIIARVDCRTARQQRHRLRWPSIVRQQAEVRALIDDVVISGAGNNSAGGITD